MVTFTTLLLVGLACTLIGFVLGVLGGRADERQRQQDAARRLTREQLERERTRRAIDRVVQELRASGLDHHRRKASQNAPVVLIPARKESKWSTISSPR